MCRLQFVSSILSRSVFAATASWLVAAAVPLAAEELTVIESEDSLRIETPQLEAVIRKSGYVSGVAGGSLRDKQTGFRDAGFGLHVVDWLMEPGSDEAYREQLDDEMVYRFGNAYHGDTAKRAVEGPQICTRAGQLEPEVIRGDGFVAIRLQYRYRTAAPGKATGSLWTQWIVFPEGKRYFISADRIDSANSGDETFLRIDMPGHIRHEAGNTFENIYLSYAETIASKEFVEDFAPDERFNYRRDRDKIPERFIRGYQLRDPETGEQGPWLAGMTLDPTAVYEAWCHQRGYVCMIQEIGGRRVEAGESFGAAYVVGYFDSLEEMHRVYDKHRGHSALEVTPDGWRLREGERPR